MIIREARQNASFTEHYSLQDHAVAMNFWGSVAIVSHDQPVVSLIIILNLLKNTLNLGEILHITVTAIGGLFCGHDVN